MLWWGIGALLAAMALGAALTAAGPDAPPAIDVGWNALMGDMRNPALASFGMAMNDIGGGWMATLLVPLGIVAALLIARRWRAAVFVAVTLLASAAAVQGLKSLFGRSRPDEILVGADFGSFPSGHTANAATLATLAVLLLPRVWVLIAGAVWALAMAFSRTLISAHWLSDTVGGMLVGAGIALVVGGLLLPWARRGRSSGDEEITA